MEMMYAMSEMRIFLWLWTLYELWASKKIKVEIEGQAVFSNDGRIMVVRLSGCCDSTIDHDLWYCNIKIVATLLDVLDVFLTSCLTFRTALVPRVRWTHRSYPWGLWKEKCFKSCPLITVAWRMSNCSRKTQQRCWEQLNLDLHEDLVFFKKVDTFDSTLWLFCYTGAEIYMIG